MNSFTSSAPVDQQAVTVDRLEKKLNELEEVLYKLQTSLHFLEWNPLATVEDLQSTKDRIKNKTDEIEDTKRQLSEARRPPVDPVERLEKRLRELDDQLDSMERRLAWAPFSGAGTVESLLADKNNIQKIKDEIKETQAQLTEAQRPRDAPQNDRVDNLMCCICHEGKSKHELFVLVPCGHRCVCSGCAPLMANQPCPVCRLATTMAIRVFD